MKAPEKLRLDGDQHENWECFKQHFKLYMTAIDADDKSDVRKIALLLTVAGTRAIDIYNTFALTDEETKKYQTVVHMFDTHFEPRTMEVYE